MIDQYEVYCTGCKRAYYPSALVNGMCNACRNGQKPANYNNYNSYGGGYGGYGGGIFSSSSPTIISNTQFENNFSDYVEAKHAVALNSCTAGLHLSLDVLKIGQGDEVVTTPVVVEAPPTLNDSFQALLGQLARTRD